MATTLDQGWEHFQRGELHRAEVLCRSVLQSRPQAARGWLLLAFLADRAGRLDDALAHARRAIDLDPTDPASWNKAALLHEQRGEVAAAERSLREALLRNPNYAIGYNNLGEVLRRLGRPDEAHNAYERALAIAPDFAAARSNQLMSLLYDPSRDGASIEAEHRRLAAWWSQRADASGARDPSPGTMDSKRRLCIGYVSPDFREHAVARFFEPLLAAHDRSRFRIVLYSECPAVDEVGQRLRRWGDAWRITWQRSSRDVAEQVRADDVDVLIDLAGHTRHNRLDVFALRPAPLQATYLGYPGITGLTAIDCRLTDEVLDPASEFLDPNSAHRSEARIRISTGYACFEGPAEAPAVVPPPSVTRGYVTFASHHPLIKLNDPLLETWAELLDRLPEARLMFLRSEFVGDVAVALGERIARSGLDPARCAVVAESSQPREYLARYGEIDVVLDAAPFNGHTMTCEALWMGVPVVTLRGDRPAGRLSASVLTVLGLTDLIATTRSEYLAIAESLARDVVRRAALRASLRSRVADRLAGSRWIGGLEEAYLRMWRETATGSSPENSPG